MRLVLPHSALDDEDPILAPDNSNRGRRLRDDATHTSDDEDNLNPSDIDLDPPGLERDDTSENSSQSEGGSDGPQEVLDEASFANEIPKIVPRAMSLSAEDDREPHHRGATPQVASGTRSKQIASLWRFLPCTISLPFAVHLSRFISSSPCVVMRAIAVHQSRFGSPPFTVSSRRITPLSCFASSSICAVGLTITNIQPSLVISSPPTVVSNEPEGITPPSCRVSTADGPYVSLVLAVCCTCFLSSPLWYSISSGP
ncbi:hypothetical protein B0H21DRAFT_823485 [Amylocystis lapponica]|nr:hypothetical protein B0H21DRAFT_823485 [Amylocystis lapponica]